MDNRTRRDRGMAYAYGTDVSARVLAAGNPCRVIREITEEDTKYHYKDRVFEDEIWKIVKKTK